MWLSVSIPVLGQPEYVHSKLNIIAYAKCIIESLISGITVIFNQNNSGNNVHLHIIIILICIYAEIMATYEQGLSSRKCNAASHNICTLHS